MGTLEKINAACRIASVILLGVNAIVLCFILAAISAPTPGGASGPIEVVVIDMPSVPTRVEIDNITPIEVSVSDFPTTQNVWIENWEPLSIDDSPPIRVMAE